MKRVLVCGATGFIGRNIVERFAVRDDIKVIAVYNNRPSYQLDFDGQIEWVKADLRNPEDVKRIMKDIDIVIQAAATTSGEKDMVNKPYIHVTDNAVMNSYLLREAYENKVEHFIFFSCTVMYQSSNRALKEEDWDASQALHERYFGVGNTKIYIENMLEFYSRISNMKTTAIRHSNIYGPHDKFDFDRSHVFGATVSKVMLADKSISVWGTGEEERDLLYVDDLVDFVIAAIKNQKNNYELYNCGLGKKVSIRDLVKKVIKHSGKDIEIEYDTSQPTIKTSLYLDNSKAINDLGWKPMTSLDDGIKRTLSWWNDNIDPKKL